MTSFYQIPLKEQMRLDYSNALADVDKRLLKSMNYYARLSWFVEWRASHFTVLSDLTFEMFENFIAVNDDEIDWETNRYIIDSIELL
jgi:hypothetical protein